MAAFLDMDKRQSIASSGVDAVRSVTPERDLSAQWASTEKACFDAGAAYLAAVEQFDGIVTTQAQAAFQNAAHELGEAAKAVDRFYSAHRDTLEHARSALAATPRLAQDAKAAAEKALERLRSAFRQTDFEKLEGGRVSFSGGVAQYEPGQTIYDLYKNADRALYNAKTSGRDRISSQRKRRDSAA